MQKLKQLQQELELKFKDMKCLVKKDDFKFSKVTNNLPCSNKEFPESDQKVNAENKLKCCYCNSEYLISSTEELSPTGLEIDEFIQFNNHLNEFINISIKELDDNDQQVEFECTRTKQEITEKIREHKEKIEIVHLKMIEKLELIQENLVLHLNSLATKIAKKNSDYESLSKKIDDSIDEIDENQLISEIYKFQELIDQMENLEETFQNIFKKFSFESSLWKPNEDFIHPALNKLK